MTTMQSLREQSDELRAELQSVVSSKSLTAAEKHARLDAIERKNADLENAIKNHRRANAILSATDLGDPGVQARPFMPGVTGKSVRPASPTDLGDEVWAEAFEAATRRKGFRAQIGAKAPTTIGLPAVVQPNLTQVLPYEPDRLLDHIPMIATDAPTVEYIAHTGNTNPAAVVAELGTKPDLGMQLSPHTVSMTKIAALASASMEALQDFDTFRAFIPNELQRAIIDEETAFVAGQLLATTGTLTRAKGSTEAPLDTMLEAFNDLRTGAAYVEPNLIALHPTTWTYLRQQKDQYGRYLLNPDPTSGQRPNVWGVPVVTNTHLTAGEALVLNTSCVLGWTRMGLTIDSDNGYSATNFATNAVTFRAEERIAVGALKPAGINIVTGLAASS